MTVAPELAAAGVLVAQAAWGAAWVFAADRVLAGRSGAEPAPARAAARFGAAWALLGPVVLLAAGAFFGGVAALADLRGAWAEGVTAAAFVLLTHAVLAWAAWIFLTPPRRPEVAPPAREAVAAAALFGALWLAGLGGGWLTFKWAVWG